MQLKRIGAAFDRMHRIEQNSNLEKIEQASNSLQSQINGLIDGNFDEAALNTHIEEKLNDLETQYAPQLTQVTEQVVENAKQKNWVNVLDFGAKCDGVTDDTEALKEAIRSSANGLVAGSSLWKKVIYIPSNMFIGSSEKIVIPYSNVCLKGNSRSNSAIIFGHKNGGFHFVKDSAYIYEPEIKNLIIKGNGICDTLLKMTNFANLYIENVSFQSWSIDGYAADIEGGSLVFMDKVTIDGGSPTNTSNTCVLNGFKFKNCNFVQMSGFNTWNLKRAFTLTTPSQNFIYRDSWTEYTKTLVYIEPSSNSFVNNKITVSNTTLSNGSLIGDFSLVDYATNAQSNLFGNYILIDNMQLYLHASTTLKNNTLINIDGIVTGSNVYIDIDNSNINGWSFGTIAKVILLNTSVTALSNFIKVVRCNLRTNGTYIKSTDVCNVPNVAYHVIFNSNESVPSFIGGIKLSSDTGNVGRMYFAGGTYYMGYSEGILPLPKQSTVSVPLSTATDVNTLKTDLNTLITRLKSSGIIV